MLYKNKFEIAESEIEEFENKCLRFDEICKKIITKKQALGLIEHKINQICNEASKTRNEIRILKDEQRELEVYLINKHRKTVIIENKINKLLEMLSTFNEDEKVKYLLSNPKEYELFINLDLNLL